MGQRRPASVLRAIWAQSNAGAIGDGTGMLWHVPEDLAFFKRATDGMPVVMGRKTWESFPQRFRPLPNRRNIVVTSNADYIADGADVVQTVDEAIELAAVADDEVWIIGGATIYAQTLDRIDEAWVTEIDTDATGAALAPTLGADWAVSAREPSDGGWLTSQSGTRYRFVVYVPRDTLEA